MHVGGSSHKRRDTKFPSRRQIFGHMHLRDSSTHGSQLTLTVRNKAAQSSLPLHAFWKTCALHGALLAAAAACQAYWAGEKQLLQAHYFRPTLAARSTPPYRRAQIQGCRHAHKCDRLERQMREKTAISRPGFCNTVAGGLIWQVPSCEVMIGEPLPGIPWTYRRHARSGHDSRLLCPRLHIASTLSSGGGIRW